MVRVYHLIQAALLILALVFRVSAQAPATVAQTGAYDYSSPANRVNAQPITLTLSLVFPVAATDSAVIQASEFSKTSPANGATEQPITPTLSWGSSADATSYQYCYDTSGNSSCDSGWESTDSTSVGLGVLISNTTYYWQVQAINAISTTEADNGSWYSFTTGIAPAAFNKLNPINGASGQSITPTLSWGDSADATSYQYCYDTSDNSSCDTGWVITDSTSVELSGLSYGTTYYWQVQAVNAISATEADSGAWFSFTTGIAPGAFNKSSPANGATGQPITPTLSWGSSEGAPSYQYCYTLNYGGCDTGWVITDSTSVELSGLISSTTYYWQVQAVNAISATEADSGSWYSFTTGIAPGAFNKSGPANGVTGQTITPTLSWGSSAAATSYQYCYDTSGNSSCDSGWVITDSTSVRLGVLISNTTYYWQVQAINAISATEADSGAWYSFTTGIAPGAFNKSSPTNGATGQPITPTLSWEGSTDATNYQYCYDTSDNSSCDTSWESTGISTSVGLSGLSYSTTYYWQVRAVNAISTTQADSGIWFSFTTYSALPTPPSNLSQSGATQTSVTLLWQDNSNNENGFNIYRWNGYIFAYWASVGANITSYTVTGLPCEAVYAYNVTAYNGNGESSHAAWINATSSTCERCYLPLVSK